MIRALDLELMEPMLDRFSIVHEQLPDDLKAPVDVDSFVYEFKANVSTMRDYAHEKVSGGERLEQILPDSDSMSLSELLPTLKELRDMESGAEAVAIAMSLHDPTWLAGFLPTLPADHPLSHATNGK